jgi:hypothetical protein
MSMLCLFPTAIILPPRPFSQPYMPPLGTKLQLQPALFKPACQQLRRLHQNVSNLVKCSFFPMTSTKDSPASQTMIMMRLYSLFDQTGSPHCHLIMDQVHAQLKVEITRNQFDPSHSFSMKRDEFMARVHHEFPSLPPESIHLELNFFLNLLGSTHLMSYNSSKSIFSDIITTEILANQVTKSSVHPEHQVVSATLIPHA